MKITSGSVALQKDEKNLIGISIGGGAPLCPCLYIVQISENGSVAADGTLECGDEITAVNGESVKGKSKVEVAKMIKSVKVFTGLILFFLYSRKYHNLFVIYSL